MKKSAFFLCMVILLCSFQISVLAAEPQPTETAEETEYDDIFADSDYTARILFIGNSYTYYNNFCATFTNLCRNAGQNPYVRQVTKGRHSLSQAANEKDVEGARVRYLLTTQKWDYVILQERHNYPIAKPQRMTKAVKKLEPYIKAAGAEMILFMTWAPDKGHVDYRKFRKKVPSKAVYYEKLKNYFYDLAEETNAVVAPVGTAFYRCQKQFPGIRLLRKDHSHPVQAGSYLSACVIYETIFKKSPVGLSYKGNFTVKKAKKLQKIAGSVMNTINEQSSPSSSGTQTETEYFPTS